ncbi:MAG: DUF72 domain-containing protein [Betaproteobacteria bacterium]
MVSRNDPLPCEPRLNMPESLSAWRTRLFLGTSSWSFPGWEGLVYDKAASESILSRRGLSAYAQHPLLNAAGIDRGFYAPVSQTQFQQYADQVPRDFRFLVKAPDLITGATLRDESGRHGPPNPSHLDAQAAIAQFVEPCMNGLGERAGVLVFQFSPLPRAWLSDAPGWIARLGDFLSRLPRGPCYAVELRDPALITPRLVRTLAETSTRYCISLHNRMPPIDRQLRALDALDSSEPGPLIVRWNLHQGLGYAAARRQYAPFNRLIDEDPATRQILAERAAATILAGRSVTVIANNKAEGSAPLTLLRLAEAIARSIEAGSAAAGTGRSAS